MDVENPFKLISSTKKYENPWISVREDSVIRPGGSEGIFGVIEMSKGSSVVAIDNDDHIYLSKEYKYGISSHSIETFSGAFEENENPIDAAKRELEEELGMVADNWIELGYIDPFTTVVNSPNYIFLATDLSRTNTNPDPGELIEIIKIPFEEAYNMVIDGSITHGASCVGILKTHLYRLRSA